MTKPQTEEMPPGVTGPEQIERWRQVRDALLRVIDTGPTSTARVDHLMSDAYAIGLQAGRAAGHTEGYKKARHIYKKRRPSIHKIASEEFRVMLEELRRMTNCGRTQHASQLNDRIVLLATLLRAAADDAILQRDKILGIGGDHAEAP